MSGPRILLVVGGGIAAYKSCELVRLIRKGGGDVTCVLTEGGSKFVTPMSLAALSENPVHTTLWDLRNEVEMGHIQLSREADIVVVCPATADLLAKMASGIADDLATTLMLATDKPVMAVPAMNVRMWEHPATQRNVEALGLAGVYVMNPDEGPMACGEFGPGRLPDPLAIWHRIAWALDIDPGDVPALPEPGSADAMAVTYQPEGEHEPGDGSADVGLGGLSASMVLRGQKLQNLPEMPASGFADGSVDAELPADGPIDLTGPLLSSKGAARAAPPTDPEAINHHVNERQEAPQPFEAPGDAVASEPLEQPEAPEQDVLAGQPDFETDPEHRPLYGKHVLVTAGPTHEPIDPVRYIANRSSGKQGFAIASAAAAAGARVTLVAGPVNLDTPPGVVRIDVESAREMFDAVKAALPADVAVMVAAVADWRTKDYVTEKMKKRGSAPPALMLTENPDILATIAGDTKRPRLLIGFAAETEDVIKHAKSKRKRKGADWIVANDVSGDVMGGDSNSVHIVSEGEVDSLPEMSKEEVAEILVERIIHAVNR
jgi:phosphopantothenoylcysteine decarboxylase/phosphopantothenate--cysteine ligase